MSGHTCILATDAAALDRRLVELEAAGATTIEFVAQGVDRFLVTASFDDDATGRAAVRKLRDRGMRAVSGPRSPGELSAWRRHTAPVDFAPRSCVCFPWSSFQRSAYDEIIEIDPGAGFGSGGHPSTRLLLEWLHSLDLDGARILDVGCGTGVLGIVAAGRGGCVTAIDIAPDAVRATTRNAEWNDVSHALTVSLDALSEVEPAFDVIVANIHASVLTSMARDFRRVLAPGGMLSVSGISRAQVSRLEAGFAPLCSVGERELDDWVALAVQLPATPEPRGRRGQTEANSDGSGEHRVHVLDRGHEVERA